MEMEMKYGEDYHYLPVTSLNSGVGLDAAVDVYVVTIQIVNVCFVSFPDRDNWVLVDAGMPRSSDDIVAAAEERFGTGTRPVAIVLTHGHFDHVGAIIELIERWNVPIYAHEEELPYLTGKLAYPPADPSASSGLVAKLSPWFPNEPIDLGARVTSLPADGSIPEMPGWKWIHTPGHTPGHVSLFRDADKALIAGDAFVTVKQESIYKVFTQKAEISGPPKYFTTDWQAAFHSVRRLAALQPTVAVTGHGVPLSGGELAASLQKLVTDFDRIAVPEQGKHVH
ncbi:glyoxylase-like metal-dependent hydrolase (beta-lactamase superfamily II) [Paenibacillus cellulosilyticus]|uniref:Glyoxylase-like metal-dependent hydrolase (Beta-lactamase superfamily II) n=1 Tax=Paenibacillus cellulosilyticus TaxID=375489 RepID=A0A2V2YXT7_9BACL|nr:MBL fold metallo-hydrolase [Paenibacillus cellulosilyticus]PWW05110.1 glyoxylase-like metal-dependent hydrolase (beta-lactamase superfamily II) [Paenibacillus cellulosilyticus]QKS48660.1 MBL fold metallo-hydrolase [Paenibacillus cellulosilyticus]